MLEKASDDGAHLDALGDSGNAGSQAAQAADDAQAWELAANGQYSRAGGSGNLSAQAKLLSRYDERIALTES